MLNFLQRFNNTTQYDILLSDTRSKHFTAAFGVQKYEKPFIAGSMDDFVVYVASDYVDAQRIWRTLQAIKGKFAYLPFKEDVLLYKRSINKQYVYQRNAVLDGIVNGKYNGIVVCIEALMQLYPERTLFDNVLELSCGASVPFATLHSRLRACGYRRCDSVEDAGEYAVHGDIVDLYTQDGRYRVDFFDDIIESITAIAQDKTTNKVQSVRVCPLAETSGADQKVIDALRDTINRRKTSADVQARLTEIVDTIAVDGGGDLCDNGWLMPFLPNSTLAQYLPNNAVIVWDEPKLIAQRVDFLYNEHNMRVASLTEAGEILPLHAEALTDNFRLYRQYDAFRQLAMQTLPYGGTFFNAQSIHKFVTGAVAPYMLQLDRLRTDMNNWLHGGYEVAILGGESNDIDNVVRLLCDEGIAVELGDKLQSGAQHGLVLPISVENGFVSHSNKLVVIGTRDLGRKMSGANLPKSKKRAFLAVEKGDYVVHDFHGIGLCEGMQKITSPDGESKDYIVVTYKKGDRLYVPAENSDTLSRYSGGENPTLSKLGGDDFAKVKSKVKASVKAMSFDLLKLYSERQRPRGFKYATDSYLQEAFARAFAYTPTEDQIKSINEIRQDLMSDRIMDRVLVGDVGFGKTEVAMRAAFDVVCNKRQVAVLVPTTILAEQHYRNFVKRMQPFDIKVACVNRFRTPQQQDKILSDTATGKVDILIGTHRLLSRDVHFDNLGLLVLDEEQRFGVEHKEKLKTIKKTVDVLTLSATPIPRTLHMALSGIRDISTITTPPVKRMPVETFVTEESDAMMRDIVLRELGRGGQVFFVYNRVETIDSFQKRLSQLLPDARIIVAHGQMAENVLEDSVYSFQQGKADVLLCTTIIENGIDIPNVNTLIVYDADNLGLSQLYQLRGRVGRGDKLAYAYFLYRQNKILNSDAYKRLSSIMQYTQLGSGFKIAMKDLEIRGAGNVLGREQHGHMMKVGYDMYARLLKEAVAEAKGQKDSYIPAAQMEVDLDAYAPEDYIAAQSERMEFYQELACAQDIEQLDKLRAQTEQVYGAIPKQLDNLFLVANLKVKATQAGITKVTVHHGRGELLFGSKELLLQKKVVDTVLASPNRYKFSSVGYEVVVEGKELVAKQRLLAAIDDFLQSVSN